jgi:hypothetical protein
MKIEKAMEISNKVGDMIRVFDRCSPIINAGILLDEFPTVQVNRLLIETRKELQGLHLDISKMLTQGLGG